VEEGLRLLAEALTTFKASMRDNLLFDMADLREAKALLHALLRTSQFASGWSEHCQIDHPESSKDSSCVHGARMPHEAVAWKVERFI
jgi:hypothetical protein